jgi:hypothetical protein
MDAPAVNLRRTIMTRNLKTALIGFTALAVGVLVSSAAFAQSAGGMPSGGVPTTTNGQAPPPGTLPPSLGGGGSWGVPVQNPDGSTSQPFVETNPDGSQTVTWVNTPAPPQPPAQNGNNQNGNGNTPAGNGNAQTGNPPASNGNTPTGNGNTPAGNTPAGNGNPQTGNSGGTQTGNTQTGSTGGTQTGGTSMGGFASPDSSIGEMEKHLDDINKASRGKKAALPVPVPPPPPKPGLIESFYDAVNQFLDDHVPAFKDDHDAELKKAVEEAQKARDEQKKLEQQKSEAPRTESKKASLLIDQPIERIPARKAEQKTASLTVKSEPGAVLHVTRTDAAKSLAVTARSENRPSSKPKP